MRLSLVTAVGGLVAIFAALVVVVGMRVERLGHGHVNQQGQPLVRYGASTYFEFRDLRQW